MKRLVVALAIFAGCSPRPAPAPRPLAVASASASVAPSPSNVIGGARPVEVFVPSGTDQPMPVVMMLHAFGVNGSIEELFFRLRPWARAKGFLYLAPDGSTSDAGRTYWNATDACCAPELATGKAPTPDDEGYLMGLLDEVARRWKVDPKRVYLVGHSNGAFMAHRLACRHAARIAAMVTVAGATYAEPAKCAASEPVSVLQVHGTADTTVRYEGGAYFGHPYPSAKATAERWAALDGCGPEPGTLPSIDVDGSIDGAETRVLRWPSCRSGASVELWTIEGGSHVPVPTTLMAESIVEFLFAHPKP